MCEIKLETILTLDDYNDYLTSSEDKLSDISGLYEWNNTYCLVIGTVGIAIKNFRTQSRKYIMFWRDYSYTELCEEMNNLSFENEQQRSPLGN